VKKKHKKYGPHLAIREETFEEFQRLRGHDYPSNDAFLKKLLSLYDKSFSKEAQQRHQEYDNLVEEVETNG
jgi:hypothetical protein